MMNPVRSLMSDPEGKSTPIGTELAEKVKMRREADKAMAPTSAAEPAKVSTPMKSSPVDLVNPGNKGTTGREALDKMNSKYPDLPKMHTGGTVPKTGPYVMKQGEHVLTPEKHGKLKAAMGLAMDALSQEPDEDDMPQEPAKVGKDMTIRRLHDQSFHMKHRHEPPHDMPEHDEEYSAPDLKGLHGHIDAMWGKK
jgi:hypothetical protein